MRPLFRVISLLALPFAPMRAEDEVAPAPAAGAVQAKPSAKASDPSSAKAPEPLQPGHSMHGEAFNEGPRQFAVLMPGVQSVNFPITSRNGEAQKFFNQGVAQMHSFWGREAERSFLQAAALDPEAPALTDDRPVNEYYLLHRRVPPTVKELHPLR